MSPQTAAFRGVANRQPDFHEPRHCIRYCAAPLAFCGGVAHPLAALTIFMSRLAEAAKICDTAPSKSYRYPRAPISHKYVTNLFCDIRLLHRIALRRVDALSNTGFSLCGLSGDSSTLHRLMVRQPSQQEPVLRDCPEPALSLVEVNPAETSAEFM